MSKHFNMELFLNGVMTGSESTRKRHLRQAKAMQEAIEQRWQRNNPWNWRLKHVHWFLTQHLKNQSSATRYYYRLTALLIWKRLGNDRARLIQRSPRGCLAAPDTVISSDQASPVCTSIPPPN